MDSILRENLDQHFNEKGPYYTSYPTRGEWKNDFGSETYLESLKDFYATHDKDTPVHLYIHIPYCAKLCYYCICNIKVSNNRDTIQGFVDLLLKEISMLNTFFEENHIKPFIREMHLGGGTPSHLAHDQLKEIVDALGSFVDFKRCEEFSMEIDPRTIKDGDLPYYASLGVQRISFGVQDFNPKVQEAINRVQPREMVEKLISGDIRRYFSGLNFDLLYGLPYQTRETFRETVQITNELKPDRVTLLKYAHVPEVRPHMQLIKADTLPHEEEIPFMFYDAVNGLTSAGYKWVGIDNFALPTDELGKAVDKRTVGRNFGGFTPGRTKHLIGLGPSTTFSFGKYYCQSTSDTDEYMRIIAEGRFPMKQGHVLGPDEELRREAIFSLICNLHIDFDAYSREFDVDFREYFAEEIKRMRNEYVPREYVKLTDNSIEVTELGRYFLRGIAKVFDLYHRDSEYRIAGP